MYVSLAILAMFTVVYSAVARRVERTWISGPIVFTAFGLLVGREGLGVVGTGTDVEMLRTLAELTLAMVLFTDAAGTDLAVLRRTRALPIRLLVLGLPLSIALGFGAGRAVFPDLDLLEIALLATMLAPTDAALGKAVVTNEAVPDDVRQGLNVESGLNDGICVPILFLFLALVGGEEAGEPWRTAVELFLEAVGIGLACGAVLSLGTVGLLHFCRRRGWQSPPWTKVTMIALALACFGSAQALGGSGFIASFAGGMLFGALLKPHHEPFLNAAEGIGDAFALVTWVFFGAAVVGPSLEKFTWTAVLYAVLSLTVVRMLPVFLVTAGLGQSVESRLFMGWFGPRGLASIVFGVIVFGARLPHGDLIATTVVCTVLLSIVAHGLTANPWAKAFGARAAAAPRPPA